MTGKVERIYIAENKRNAVTPVKNAELVASKGIVGDRYYSHPIDSQETGSAAPRKNISLIARE